MDTGHGIYKVEIGDVSYWLIAKSGIEAIGRITLHLGSIEGEPLDPDEEPTAKKLRLEEEIALHADRLGIKHTVEEWLVIYDGYEGGPYLGCSEY